MTYYSNRHKQRVMKRKVKRVTRDIVIVLMVFAVYAGIETIIKLTGGNL